MHFTEYDTRLAAYALVLDLQARHLNDGAWPTDHPDREQPPKRHGQPHMLLTWYNGTGRGAACWTLPGGGVDFKEAPHDAVVREVYEETGYAVALDGPLAIHTFTLDQGVTPDRPYKGVQLLYAAHVTGGSLGTVEVGGTTDLAAWFPMEALPRQDPLSPIVRMALKAHDARDLGGLDGQNACW